MALGRRFANLLAPLLVPDHADLDAGLDLFRTTRLGAFDSVLAAAVLRRGMDGLVSGDAAFDGVPGLPALALDGPRLAELAGFGSEPRRPRGRAGR